MWCITLEICVFKKFWDKALFTKTEIRNVWNVHFLENSPLEVQHAYLSKYSINWSTFETSLLIWCDSAISYFFLSPPSPGWIFRKGNKKKLYWIRSDKYREYYTFTILHFNKNCHSKRFMISFQFGMDVSWQ